MIIFPEQDQMVITNTKPPPVPQGPPSLNQLMEEPRRAEGKKIDRCRFGKSKFNQWGQGAGQNHWSLHFTYQCSNNHTVAFQLKVR